MSTTNPTGLAVLLAEKMQGRYDGPPEERRRSARFLVEDLLSSQHDCDTIEEEIARLKERIYARRRDYIHIVHDYGLTTRRIAEALGLSHQRVAQILQEPYDS